MYDYIYVCVYIYISMFKYISYTYMNDSPLWYCQVYVATGSNKPSNHLSTQFLSSSHPNHGYELQKLIDYPKNLRPIDVKPPKSGWRILHKARIARWPHPDVKSYGGTPGEILENGNLGFICQSSPL